MEKCQICGKPATFTYKMTVNGKTTVINLCPECLANHGHEFKELKNYGMNGFFSGDIMSAPGDFFGSIFAPKTAVSKGAICPHCGMSAKDIAESYKLGCSECYKTFPELVAQMVKNIGGGEYAGESYGAEAVESDNGCSGKDELEALQEELNRAVKEERYGDADKIFGRIKELKAESEGKQ